ncbi:MAG: hypothetical protein QG671_1091 [Actinomycetota bacterium]|nr:hypothetical protein [Actinomycetota bacterium]
MRHITHSDLYNLTRRITKQLDHTKIRAGHLGDKERYRRRELLDAISDAILEATLIPRPAGATCYALDGIGIWAAEKAPTTSDVVDTPDRRVEADDDQDHTPAQMDPTWRALSSRASSWEIPPALVSEGMVPKSAESTSGP